MTAVKLLHWNILFSEKSKNILSLVQDMDPDIFCCQEINDTPRDGEKDSLVKQLSKLLPRYYWMPANLTGSQGEKFELGNGIFSKFPITSGREVVLWDGPNATSGNLSEKRTYVEVELDVQDKVLIVGTTHLSFAPYFEDTSDRVSQADKLLRATRVHDSRFILTGDFNSAPDTKIIKQFEKHYKSAGPTHSQPTFTTIPFSFLGFEAKGLDWRVDYIFTTPDLKVLSSKIISTEFSDHLPIFTEIEL